MNGAPKHPSDDNRLQYLATALAFVFALFLCILLWPRKTSSSGDEISTAPIKLPSAGQLTSPTTEDSNPETPSQGAANTDKSAPTNVSIEPINIDFSNATNALALYSPDIGLNTKQGNKSGPKQSGSASSGSPTIKNSPSRKAITKGSFTVWTVPEDPNPGQPYWVVILVKHKKTLVNYTRVDLTGTVVGTDNYRALIATHQPAKFRVKSDMARLALRIPGGAKLVKDVINIKSSMLNEKQTVAIIF